MPNRRCMVTVLWAIHFALTGTLASAQGVSLSETRVASSVDGVEQPVWYWAPTSAKSTPRPLLVSLHTWSSDYTQDRTEWLVQAQQRDWVYLQPNFRGVNQSREACGSLRARRDILDAIDWALDEFKVDETRIYLCGVSGGGHMTMLMAGYHPERFSAATAWVGISDLGDWYRFHTRGGTEQRYARMVNACCGGPPGNSAATDLEYYRRSPIHFLQYAVNLPLDLNTGVHDGKEGSVPIHQTLRAYNKVIAAKGEAGIPEKVMDELWEQGRLTSPMESDAKGDPSYSRKVLLRRQSGPTRVTVFEGGHEALPAAACRWLEQQSRPTRRPAAEALP